MTTAMKMPYTTPFARPSVAFLALGLLVGLAGRVRQGLVQAGRAFKNRRETVILARFDDKMLSDIGLTRSDVRDAYSQPLWADPSAILASRVQERRSNRTGLVEMHAPFSTPSLVPDYDVEAPRIDRPARYTM